MARRLIDFDPETRTATWHSYDHSTKETRIETVQDAAPYLAANKARMNIDTATGGGLNSVSRAQIKKGWWHVATVPNGVQLKIAEKLGIPAGWIYKREYWPLTRRMLNDPEYAGLRTTPGRV